MKTILDFQSKKQRGEKISVITCYDYSFARIVNESQIECILVGDTAAVTMFGYANTLPIDVQLLGHLVGAVSRGAPHKFIIGDLPFLSFRKDLASNIAAVEVLMKAGAHAVKLEGAVGNIDLVAHLVQSGVPVMGHLGLTPQSIHQLGGFRVQGREDLAAKKLIEHAHALEEAGCFAMVLECVPSSLAKTVAESLEIPIIGIGAGPDVDGQVLVLQDMLGMDPNFKPKFLRTYFQGFNTMKEVFDQYHNDVVSRQFPTDKESY